MISPDKSQQNIASDIESLARQSLGSSCPPFTQRVAKILVERGFRNGILVDVGCGNGNLWSIIGDRFQKYLGVDAVQYAGLPQAVEITVADLNASPIPLPEGLADVVVVLKPLSIWKILVLSSEN